MTQPSSYSSIAALDLSTVCSRLMHPHAGYGWNEARTRAAEFAYREFLLFAKTFPAETPTPSPDVDAFWHFHILDTLKYTRDCAMAFGYFLHHKPDLNLAKQAAQAGSCDKTLAIMREALAAGGIAEVGAYCAASNEKQFRTTASNTAYCAVASAAEAAAYCAVADKTAYCAVASTPATRQPVQ